MAFRYQIEKGAEHRDFAEEGVRRISDAALESDHELFSPYLTIIEDKPAEQASTPPAPIAPVNQANSPLNEQSANKEAAK